MPENNTRWMIAFTVILLAIVEVLDMTIVSVAMLDMKGALAASPTEITWTITVYVVSSAIFMPLTGFVTKSVGRKRLLLFSSMSFGLASALCGLSTSLTQIVIFRGLQGVFGAFLPAVAQATLLETFPGKERNKAMALFGVGIMLAPILGPILGGYITDHWGWRWIFYINVPVCLIAVLLTTRYINDTQRIKQTIDWSGLTLLAIGVGSIQYVLDTGNEKGWFGSHLIQLFSTIGILGVFFFILRGIGNEKNIVDFQVFKDRNYVLSCIAMFIYCAAMIGSFSWLPLWMEIFLGYPASTAGLILAPRGAACLLVILLTPVVLKYLDARISIVIAALLYFAGTYLMTGYNLQVSPANLFWPNILQGIGTGFFFVPLTSLAYQSLNANSMDTASGLFNFFRSVGASVGVALFSTIMSTQGQKLWNTLGGYINPFSQALNNWLNINHLTLQTPATYAHLASTVSLQSNMIAFNDANLLFAGLALLILPLMPFLGAGNKTVANTAH